MHAAVACGSSGRLAAQGWGGSGREGTGGPCGWESLL